MHSAPTFLLPGAEQSRLLGAAVVQCPVSVVITDQRGRIVHVNPQVTRTTGYSEEELLGQPVRVLKSGQHGPEFYALLWARLTAGFDWQGEICNRRKNGELFWERATISPVRDEEGRITHYLAVKEEITAERRVRAQLEEARRRAEEAVRAKDQFLAHMSHELRTPLNAINGVTQTLLEGSAGEALRSPLELVRQAGQDLLAMVEEVLCHSALQAGRLRLEESLFSPEEVVRHGVRVAEEVRGGRTLPIELRLDARLPRRCLGDPLRWQQILANLLGNAVKFTAQGKVRVTVRSRPLGDRRYCIVLSVSDTGPGIEKAALARLFEPFTQADETIRRRFGGTGLGLAIVKDLVALMGGEVRVRSRLGKGSCFRVRLEVSEGSVLTEEPAVLEKRTPAKRRPVGEELPLRILVADDIRTNLETARLLLRHLGYAHPVMVMDGQAAVEAAARETFDFILLDLHMPVMDGLAAAVALREQERAQGLPRRRIVCLTASTLASDREACLAAGMDDYLTKPLLPRELERRLREWYGLPTPTVAVSPVGVARGLLAQEVPLFDEERLSLLTASLEEAGPALVETMVEAFRRDLEELRPRMAQACVERQAGVLQSLVHGAKGAALTVGWSRLGLACQEVLGQLRAGTFTAWAEWPARLETLLRESETAWDQRRRTKLL